MFSPLTCFDEFIIMFIICKLSLSILFSFNMTIAFLLLIVGVILGNGVVDDDYNYNVLCTNGYCHDLLLMLLLF